MTFEHSKLTRAGAPDGMRELYRAALALRARAAPATEAEASADGRRLTVRRGPYTILANFGDEPWPLRRASRCSPPARCATARSRPLAGAVLR